MRKLKLDVDALKVEEFATEDVAEARGTVRGHYQSYPAWDCPRTWNNYGCETISGEHACICADSGSPTCFKCHTDEATCGTCWETCDLAACP